MQATPGKIVIVKAYPERELTRRIVGVLGEIVYLITEEEWDNSRAQHRQPAQIGFRIKDIVRVLS